MDRWSFVQIEAVFLISPFQDMWQGKKRGKEWNEKTGTYNRIANVSFLQKLKSRVKKTIPPMPPEVMMPVVMSGPVPDPDRPSLIWKKEYP